MGTRQRDRKSVGLLSQVDLGFTHLSAGSLDGGYATALNAARFQNGVLLQCPVAGFGTYFYQKCHQIC